jgi:hypothetical protein
MKRSLRPESNLLLLSPKSEQGSVLLVTIGIVAILMVIVGVTLLSTTNKYFTAYQWASWQEALQGAESGADITMGEMRKDIMNSASVPWVGWKVGTYTTLNGKQVKDASSEKPIDNTGYFTKTGGSTAKFNLGYFTNAHGAKSGDYVTYSTELTKHAGEGNTNLRISATIDAPVALTDSAQRQWIRVRATGSTDLAGPVRVSEEKLDNRLRKLGLFFDKVLNKAVNTPVATRQIELVAKPVSMFSGALTAMVQIKAEDKGFTTDSYNSEDLVNWPINPGNGEVDFSKSHDPLSPLGKNGDVASNAFPIHHDHSQNLDLHWTTIWGDVGNNYSQIKNLDTTYYGQTPDPTDYGLNNGNFGTVNPNSTLIKTTNNTTEGGDISGNISTNYYRDLPPVTDPNWTGSTAPDYLYTKIDASKSLDNMSTDPNNPTRVQIGTTAARGNITLNGSEKWTLKAAGKPGGWNVNTPTIHRYVQIWVTGDIKLDDGGTIIIEQKVDSASGKVISDVQATIYFDHNIKVGEEKETKTNKGGFDTQSDDAKDLILLGVTQPDSGKLPKDEYIDPLGNDSLYTPYKASGNIVFHQNDITGAIYAPDHNIVFESDDDGKGKRRKRPQKGNEFYGAYVGRTIHSKKYHYFHFDESLNDAGQVLDWGYVSWFEDVDVDHR